MNDQGFSVSFSNLTVFSFLKKQCIQNQDPVLLVFSDSAFFRCLFFNHHDLLDSLSLVTMISVYLSLIFIL